MQIACQRFGCQKAVEVCYWACKFRRNCKDWQNALAGEPGIEAIRERLESAAAKSGRVFELATLVKPARPERAAALRLAPVPARPVLHNISTARAETPPARAQTKPAALAESTAKTNPTKTKKMTKKTTANSASQPSSRAVEAPSDQPASAPKRARRIKPPANGTVYLLLGKNGRYKEVRESDLLGEAARMLKDPSLRLVKGQLLVPRITLKPMGE
jgi:hypothetical protein